ncbi:MAG TPA: FtsQ-type POTRA domain-containing protein [Solirubrobacteraceae bacterium]|nr:FtsQ-type POTRA domain-containing protein [Solirubrobacteraceae bacterium]
MARSLASAARPPRARSRGQATAIDLAIAHALRAPASLGRALGPAWAYVRTRRRLRIALIATVIALPLLGGGWLWLRNSPLVSVQQVRVSGVHGPDASAIKATLQSTAKQMSTLNVSTAKLRAAVASYPVVGDLKVQTSFPHGLRIDVVEQPPVAVLSTDGANVAVAANGTVLGTAQSGESLPTVNSGQQLTVGEQAREPASLAALSVLGAAPKPLAKKTERAYSGSKGLTLVMQGGVRAYFGDASRPHAKWAALARVLADPGSAGASYVDVRVPERPAAGFPPGVTPPAVEGAQSETESTTAGGSESAQSLEEGLASAVGTSEPSAPSGTSEESSSGEAEASAEGESGSEASAESTSPASGESSETEH